VVGGATTIVGDRPGIDTPLAHIADSSFANNTAMWSGIANEVLNGFGGHLAVISGFVATASKGTNDVNETCMAEGLSTLVENTNMTGGRGKMGGALCMVRRENEMERDGERRRDGETERRRERQ
jgi:hypothetical protein